MKIVVLGAGTVGTWIADLLCRQRHSVTVVDQDPTHTRRVNEELDVRVITGSASDTSVLFQAGVTSADVCLAVTGVDEVNLVAASIAREMGANRSIARVFSPIFRDRSTFDYERHFQVDRLLSLERLAAVELARGIRSADSLTVENIADGMLEVEELTLAQDVAALGKPLQKLKLPREVRIGTIERGDRMWIAGADDEMQLGDRITLIGQHDMIGDVKKQFHKKSEPKKTVVIAGGGETGFHLAHLLVDRRFSVTVLEEDRDRCEFLASALPHVTVLQADATRRAVLEEERVGSADVFAACIGEDENNIMACVEAREIGAGTILAIVSRPDYANVVAKLGINLAVSPRNVMAQQILSYLNRGPVISRSNLGNGHIGIYQIEVFEGSAAASHDLLNLPLPSACLIVAVSNREFVRVPGPKDRLKPGSHVVAIVEDKQADEMLALFETR
ncbi:MAG: Trk system potassium transporter TrkA [Planctomycetales bacterium]|nr:Trk system potassium transporter TrkA [Planctomycetales bacterium]